MGRSVLVLEVKEGEAGLPWGSLASSQCIPGARAHAAATAGAAGAAGEAGAGAGLQEGERQLCGLTLHPAGGGGMPRRAVVLACKHAAAHECLSLSYFSVHAPVFLLPFSFLPPLSSLPRALHSPCSHILCTPLPFLLHHILPSAPASTAPLAHPTLSDPSPAPAPAVARAYASLEEHWRGAQSKGNLKRLARPSNFKDQVGGMEGVGGACAGRGGWGALLHHTHGIRLLRAHVFFMCTAHLLQFEVDDAALNEAALGSSSGADLSSNSKPEADGDLEEMVIEGAAAAIDPTGAGALGRREAGTYQRRRMRRCMRRCMEQHGAAWALHGQVMMWGWAC